MSGLLIGAAIVPLLRLAQPFVAIGIAAAVGLGALRSDTRAFAGGFILAFAAWWVYSIREAVLRCEAVDRQAQGSCQIYGTGEQLLLASVVALAGIILVIVAMREARRV